MKRPNEEQNEARLFEIMNIANVRLWFQTNANGYPLMQASEVEKCIRMALSDDELSRFRVATQNFDAP